VPRVLIALLLAAALLAGCDDQAADPPPSSSAGPQDSGTERPSPRGTAKGWVVPNVVGAKLGPATRALRDQGFKLDLVRRSACPRGVVIGQRPTGRARRGSIVRLVVLDPVTGTCAISPATGPAKQLVSWAQREGAAPEFSGSVDLLLGNSVVQTSEDPLDRATWEMCAAYAERDCLSPLTEVADRSFATMRSTPPGSTSCPDRVEPLPRHLVATFFDSVTMVATTDEDDSCMDVLALQVWVDAQERIKAVNLLLGSP
jgi:hypothetical protein